MVSSYDNSPKGVQNLEVWQEAMNLMKEPYKPSKCGKLICLIEKPSTSQKK